MSNDSDRLEYSVDYTYECSTCGNEHPCGCGNPYYETVLKTIEVSNPPKGVRNDRSVEPEADRND